MDPAEISLAHTTSTSGDTVFLNRPAATATAENTNAAAAQPQQQASISRAQIIQVANTTEGRVTKLKVLPSVTGRPTIKNEVAASHSTVSSYRSQPLYRTPAVQMEEEIVGEEEVEGLQQLEHEEIIEEADDAGVIYHYEMVNPKQMPNVVRPITHRPIFAEERPTPARQRPLVTNYYQPQVQQIYDPDATEEFLEEYYYEDEEGGAYSFHPGSIAYEDASYAAANHYQPEVRRRGRPPGSRSGATSGNRPGRIKAPVHLEMTAELTPYSADYVPPTVSTRREPNEYMPSSSGHSISTVAGKMRGSFKANPFNRGPLSDKLIGGMAMPTPYDPNAPLRLKLDPEKALAKPNCSKMVKAYLRAEGINVPPSKSAARHGINWDKCYDRDGLVDTVDPNRKLVEFPPVDPNEEKWPLFASNHWLRTDLTKLLLRFLRAPETFPHARVCTTMPTEYYGRRGLYIIDLSKGEPVRVRDLPVDSYGNWGKGLYSGAVRYKRTPNGQYVRVPKDMLPPDERRRRYRRKPVKPEIDMSEEPPKETPSYSASVNNRKLQDLTPAELIAAAAEKDAQKPWDCKLHYASYVNPRAPEFTKIIARVQLTKADVQDSVVLLFFNWRCDPYEFVPKPYGPWAYRKSVQGLKMPEPSRSTRKRTFRVASNVTLSGRPMKRRGRPPKNFKISVDIDQPLKAEGDDGSSSTEKGRAQKSAWSDDSGEPPKLTMVTRSVRRRKPSEKLKQLLEDQGVEEEEDDDDSDDEDTFLSLPPVVRRRRRRNEKGELVGPLDEEIRDTSPIDVVAGDGIVTGVEIEYEDANERDEHSLEPEFGTDGAAGSDSAANSVAEPGTALSRARDKKDADLLLMLEQCVAKLKEGGQLNATQKERTQLLGTIQKLATGEPPVKRGRGRPRKYL